MVDENQATFCAHVNESHPDGLYFVIFVERYRGVIRASAREAGGGGLIRLLRYYFRQNLFKNQQLKPRHGY